MKVGKPTNTVTVPVIVLIAFAFFVLLTHHNGTLETTYRPRSSTLPVNMAVRLQDKLREGRSPVLPQDVIDNVRVFFVFLGYPRSGHTILGALMNAHPNIVISHQYNPCVNGRLSNKNHLFNEMYKIAT